MADSQPGINLQALPGFASLSHRMALKNEAGVMKERVWFMSSTILLISHEQKNDGCDQTEAHPRMWWGWHVLEMHAWTVALLWRVRLLHSSILLWPGWMTTYGLLEGFSFIALCLNWIFNSCSWILMWIFNNSFFFSKKKSSQVIRKDWIKYVKLRYRFRQLLYERLNGLLNMFRCVWQNLQMSHCQLQLLILSNFLFRASNC